MNIQVRTRTSLDIVSANLGDLIALPDPEAAEALNQRIVAWNVIDELHERSYVERGLIAVQFEKKQLWKHLIDPDTNTPFANFTAWMSCSQFMGCRRTNFEAKTDMLDLADVPPENLIGMKKQNIKALKFISTEVRNQPDVLQAARTLDREAFDEKIEREYPKQHIEQRKPLTIRPGRSERKVIEGWVSYAFEHDIAGSITEAIVRACEMAMHEAELEQELRDMPAEEARV